MDLVELKKNIINKTLSDEPLIFIYSDNLFLINQYIDRICEDKGLTKRPVSSIEDILDLSDDIFGASNKDLYVLKIDSLDYNIANIEIKNVIIITKEVTNEESKKYAISFNKLEQWQILDYVRVSLPGLDENEIKWLCDVCKYDIYKLETEIRKLSIFKKGDQELIFRQINEENGYCDLNNLTIFNFTNAILHKDIKMINRVLVDINNIDVEPTGVVTILYKNIKNIINIQMNPNSTAQSLGVSDYQFRAIKRNCGVFSNEQLIKMFKCVSTIDYKLKSGLIDNNEIIEYLLINMLG